MPNVPRPLHRQVRPLPIEELPSGARTDLQVPIFQDSLGIPLNCPFVVVRGREPGPKLGLCAAIHGNELNGIKIIHRILNEVDPDRLSGALVCAPVANVPAFEQGTRRFPEDARDLNTVFPGKKTGGPSEQYAAAFLTTFLKPLDYLIDVHTASEGRRNSFYVRVDLESAEARQMAEVLNPEIILHGHSGDGTLRTAARRRGIPAITVEAGNPDEFAGKMAREGETGVLHVLKMLGMLKGRIPDKVKRETVICRRSQWLRTQAGGLLSTRFKLCDVVEKAQTLAELNDPFGRMTASYQAPRAGIVIGMSRSPLAVPGTRYCHLGEIGDVEIAGG